MLCICILILQSILCICIIGIFMFVLYIIFNTPPPPPLTFQALFDHIIGTLMPYGQPEMVSQFAQPR